MVIASAARFTPVLHFCLNNKRMAEIKVPAWPIPIHQTKLVISQAQPTVLLAPKFQFRSKLPIQCKTPNAATAAEIRTDINHNGFISPVVLTTISLVISFQVLLPVINGSLMGDSKCDIYYQFWLLNFSLLSSSITGANSNAGSSSLFLTFTLYPMEVWKCNSSNKW